MTTARFVRNAKNIYEIEKLYMSKSNSTINLYIKILETIVLSKKDFEFLTSNLLLQHDLLTRNANNLIIDENDIAVCICFKCISTSKKILVCTCGYNYARYVAII
ncbi:MAG: hypothetical protein WC123_04820 [Bacilli bacterium]